MPERPTAHLNTGNTQQSVNFPNLQRPAQQPGHRLVHAHANVPGVLANITNVLAQRRVNPLGQYLKTNEHTGYAIADVDKAYDQDVTQALRTVEHTIRFRALHS